jgi:hypothetical protein
VPLSVALDYVGAILDESRKEISRLKVRLKHMNQCLSTWQHISHFANLKSEVEEYNQLCNSMETEVESLLKASQSLPLSKGTFSDAANVISPSGSSSLVTPQKDTGEQVSPRINIEEMYSKVRMASDDNEKTESKTELSREAFWREMDQSEDSFQTIARFFAKGVIQ